METKFYVSDGTLLRLRHSHVTEMFTGSGWEPTTWFNLHTEATPLDRDEAAARLPAGSDASVLDAVDPAVSAV